MQVTQISEFHSNGKLLITGEYAVLDGALSLALPTQKGQSLKVSSHPDEQLLWEAYDNDNCLWFSSKHLHTETDHKVWNTLLNILQAACSLNPNFKKQLTHCYVQTFLEFPRLWGLGTSSTLINNIAQWAKVNPYQLLFKSFGGSGYDIACAQNSTPILYRLEHEKPHTYPLQFQFSYKEQIHFIYLNQKQNSKEGITRYRKISKSKRKLADSITQLTEQLILSQTIADFSAIIQQHELLISQYIGLPTVKDQLFPDFQGTIKSLGAWGGDFVMAISQHQDTITYFKNKGYETCIPYNDMIIN
nr:GYDIA family GHMP kinase [uncultured Capnocytophaga sp.]